LSKSVQDIVPESAYAATVKHLTDFLQTGQQEGQLPLQHKDGSCHTVEYRAVANVVPGTHLSIMRDVTERIKAEEALRSSQARTRAILDSALDAIITADSDGKIVEFNPAAERIFGYPRGDVMGQDLAELIIPERHRDGHRLGLAAHLLTEDAALLDERRELTALRADGTEFPVELTVTQLPTDGPPLYTGFMRDISERQQADERQKATTEGLLSVLATADELLACTEVDALLRQAVELARDRLGVERCAIFLIDEENQQMLGTYGTDMQGNTTDERTSHFPKQTWTDELADSEHSRWRVLQDQELKDWDGQQTLSAGKKGWIVGTPITSSAGPTGVFYNDNALTGSELNEARQEMIAVYCSLLGNIIERVSTEQKLAEERNLLRTLIDNLPDHIYIKDTQGRFVLYNEAVVRHFSLPSPEWLVGKSDHDLFSTPRPRSIWQTKTTCLKPAGPFSTGSIWDKAPQAKRNGSSSARCRCATATATSPAWWASIVTSRKPNRRRSASTLSPKVCAPCSTSPTICWPHPLWTICCARLWNWCATVWVWSVAPSSLLTMKQSRWRAPTAPICAAQPPTSMRTDFRLATLTIGSSISRPGAASALESPAACAADRVEW
jgi:PAS domain S-box-containing protein